MILYASANWFRTCIRMISSLGHEVMTTPDHHSDTNAEPLVLGTFMKNTLLAFGPSKVESECAFSRCKTGILITLCYLNLFQHFLPPPPQKKETWKCYKEPVILLCPHSYYWLPKINCSIILSFDSFHPDISMHILHTVPYTFPDEVQMRIICFIIQSFSSC